MKTLHRQLLAAGLVASLGFGAIAQSQAPAQPAPATPQSIQQERGRHDPARMEKFRARMQERMAKRLGALKQKLQITASQEGAWTAWTGALQPKATNFQRPSRDQFRAMTTPQRIDFMRQRRAVRTAAIDQRLDATKVFYGTLSAEQQKVFDQEAMRFVRKGFGGKRGHRHHHHRHHHG